MRFLNRYIVCTLVSTTILAISASAMALPRDEGTKNLGGSAYFTWKIRNPISALDNAPKVIGYGCYTRDSIHDLSKTTVLHRYAIKASPKSEQWWLTYSEGLMIEPIENGYSATKTLPDISVTQFQTNVTNLETGWLKRDLDANELGLACVNGGLAGAMKYLEQIHRITISVENAKQR